MKMVKVKLCVVIVILLLTVNRMSFLRNATRETVLTLSTKNDRRPD